MSNLYAGRGEMAREMFLSFLREHGALTNSEIADLARAEANVFVGGWHVHSHMLRLEKAGTVRRIQLERNRQILWVAA